MDKNSADSKKWWEYIEYYNSKLLPIALVLLLFIIVFELFIHIENHVLKTIIDILDLLVITVFIIDLIFLALRTKNAKIFFKNYWLDILAVFPFVFAFRIFNTVYRSIVVTEQVAISQAVFHETLEVSKEVSKEVRVIREGAELGRFARISRIVARTLRVITKSKFFNIFNKCGKPSRNKSRQI